MPFIYGILTASAVYILSFVIEKLYKKHSINKILGAKERVACYNATIIVSEDDEFIGWIDNTKNLKNL